MFTFNFLKRVGFLSLLVASVLIAQAQLSNEEGWQIAPFLTGAQTTQSPLQASEATLALGESISNYDGPSATAITPELQALAAGLNNDPVRIFNYVRNRIEYQQYYGDHKGAHLTYIDGAGNDMDQASLLIALLNQAGYTATTYVYGNYLMPDASANGQNLSNWLGTTQAMAYLVAVNTGTPITLAADHGSYSTYRIDRVWVRATINGTTYDLDPSYKQRQVFNAIDYKTASGYSRSQLLTDAGGTATADYAQNVSRTAVESRLGQYANTLRTYLKTNYPNIEIEEIIGGGRILPQTITALAQAAPLAAFSPVEVTTFTTIPEQYLATFQVEVDSDINITFNAHSLQGTRLSLTFAGNNAQLWLGDTKVAEQTAGGGATASAKLSARHPFSNVNQTRTATYTRGANYDLTYSFYTNPQSSGRIEASNRQLQNYLAEGKADNSREVLTESLHSLGLKWIRQVHLDIEMVGKVQGVFFQLYHTFGRSGQENSYYVDMPGSVFTVFDAAGINFKAANSGALIGSAMEHAVIEQNTSSLALSTVKCLALANDGGQQIFKATAANFDSLGFSNYSTAQLNALRSTANGGSTLLIHADGRTTLNDWRGHGYAIFNSGRVGMIIDGGYNGGYAANHAVLSGIATHNLNLHQSTQHYFPPSLPPVQSLEPVDLLTGAYTMEQSDLTLGAQGSPRGLTFARYYDSSRNFIKSPLGNGWRHSCEGKVTLSSEVNNAFGLTQPADAVVTLVGMLVAGDFAESSMSPQELLVGSLAANWMVNRMKDNAANVQIGNQRMTYISQPDGSWNPPPGSTNTLTGGKGSFVLSPRFGGSINFDAQDRISTWKDVDNNTQTYAYTSNDADGKLSTVTDKYNRTLTFAYHTAGAGAGLLESVTDSTARSVQFAYTGGTYSGANLTTITDPESYTNTLVYDTRNRMTDWKDDSEESFSHNDYDVLDRVYRQLSQNIATHEWKFLYSPGTTLEVNPAGGIIAHLFDYKSRNIGTINALGHASSRSYDGQNHITKSVDGTGKQSLAFYDGNQNLIKVTDNANKDTVYEYDSSMRLWKVTDATNRTTTSLYYPDNKLKSVADPGGRLTQYFYRASDGLPDYVLDPGSKRTSFTGYDTYGNLTNVTRADATTTSATYNARGDLLTSTDGRGKITQFTYDKRRLLKTSKDALNNETTWAYDANGHLASVTDRNGEITTSVYDNLGHVQSVTAPDTDAVTSSYNTRDWLTGVTNGLGHATTFSYDAAGQRVSVTNALNTVTAQWTYDAAGRVSVQKDGLLKETQFVYDTVGRLDYSRDPLNHDVDHTYDNAGRSTALTNKRGKTFGFGYGTDGLPTTFTYPSSTVQNPRISQIVDREERGFPKTVQEPSGEQSALTYDGRGRVKTRIDDVGSIVWTYDNEGNATSVAETIASTTKTITRVFDYLGRVSSCTDALGYAVGYTYDNEGNVATVTYPGSKTVTYTYDGSNRLKTVTDWADRVTTYTYDSIGRLVTVARPNTTRQRLSFDNANRLTGSYEEKLSGVTVTGTLWAASYDYYNDDRVRSFAPVPLAKTQPPATATLTYNDDNQLQTYSGQTVLSDLDGNMASAPVNGTLLGVLGWDARNRLTSAGGVTYTYDAENRRVSSTANAQTTSYVYSRGARLDRLLAKVNPDGSLTRYVYGAGLLYEVPVSSGGTEGSPVYYHFDGRGDTVALSDASGNVTARMSYSPYGERTVESGTFDTPFCFNGRWGVMTETTGLLCMQARFYSPVIRRFLNEDPAGFSGGGNLYAFAGGDPVNLMDPFGLGPVGSRVSNGLAGLGAGGVGGAIGGAIGGFIVGGPAGAVAGAVYGLLGGAVGGAVEGVFADPMTLNSDDVFSSSFQSNFIGGLAGPVFAELGTLAKVGNLSDNAVQFHHPFPKYLGGNEQQILEPLPANIHKVYHIGLDDFAPRRKGAEYFKNLPPSARQQVYSDFEMYTKIFDEEWGTQLWNAAQREGFPITR